MKYFVQKSVKHIMHPYTTSYIPHAISYLRQMEW